MPERVIVRQDSEFRTTFHASPPEDPEGQHVHPVQALHQMTPYHMLLASLGSCVAIVVVTYARHHDVPLEAIELRLSYDRYFPEDCERCEEIGRYEERIEEEIILEGNLTDRDRQRLYAVSKQCPIHKMVEEGIEIASRLGEG